MPRPNRLQFPDATYHVTARGNRRGDIFLQDQDRQTFLSLLTKTTDRFDIQIFAFCLMTNHYHLFLRTPRGNLSQAMHWLHTTYTVYFNRKHAAEGHLFRGRYHAVLLASEEHWQYLSFYIHLNPVRAGLVEDPSAYPWSSYHDYTKEKPRFPWLHRQAILAAYGDSETTGRRLYRQDCLAFIGQESDFGNRRHGRPASQQPGARGGKSLSSLPATEDKKPAGVETNRQDDLTLELAKVAEVFGASSADFNKRRAYPMLRQVAYWHLVSHQGFRATEVSQYFGVSVAAVCMGIKRLEEKLNSNSALGQKLHPLLSRGPDPMLSNG